MQWPGQRDDVTDTGEGLKEAVNLSWSKQGQVSRRPGLRNYLELSTWPTKPSSSTTPTAMVEATDSSGDVGFWMAYYQASGSCVIKSVVVDSSPSLVSVATISGADVPMLVRYGTRAFYADGNNVPRVLTGIGGGQYATAGLSAPASAPSSSASNSTGNVDAGTHLVRYRYYNETYGSYSDPSPNETVEVTSPEDTITTTVVAGGSRVDKIVVEMTQANGTVFYYAGERDDTNGDVTITFSDVELSQQRIIGSSRGHAAPPAGMYNLCVHRNRLWGTCYATDPDGGYATSGDKDYLYWSAPADPESFDGIVSRKVFHNVVDVPTGLISFYSDLLVCGKSTIGRVTYERDPATDMRLEILPTTLGLWNPRCHVQAEGRLFGWGPGGIWTVEGIMPTHISKPIDETLNDDMDASESDYFHACYSDPEGVVMFFYVKSGDSYCKNAVCLDLDSGTWSKREFPLGAMASCACRDENGKNAIAVTGPGILGFLEEGYADGVEESLAQSLTVQTVAAAGWQVSVDLSINPDNKVAIYHPASGTMFTSYLTGSTIYMTPNPLGTVSVGDTLYFGAMHVSWKTKWLGADVKPIRHRIDSVDIDFIPHADGPSDVQMDVWMNFSTTSEDFTRIAGTDVWPSGVSVDVDGDMHLDMTTSVNDDGYVSMPMPNEYVKTLQIQMETYDGTGQLRFVGYALNNTSMDGGRM